MAENVYIGKTSFSSGFSFGFERSQVIPYIVEIIANGTTITHGVALDVANQIVDIIPLNANSSIGVSIDSGLVNFEIVALPTASNRVEFIQDHSFVVDVLSNSFSIKTIERYAAENDRLINIHNFLPPAYDNSEMYEFIKMFDEYLNYNCYFYKCDDENSIKYIGVLKVIERAAYFNAPMDVECDYLDYIATQRGIDTYFGKTKVRDLINDYVSTTEDRNYTYRRLISDLPLLYMNKSTELGTRSSLLEFGVVTTIYNIWENELGEKIQVRSPFKMNWDGAYTNEEVPPDRGFYPTSHIVLTIKSDVSESLIPYIVQLLNETKPINVVIDDVGLDFVINIDSNICGSLTDTTYSIGIYGEY